MPRGTPEHGEFHITSPQDGDRYSVPVGTDPRYATIALRAVGGAGVRWYVDGRAWQNDRWPIAQGRHTIRAVDARGNSDQVSVDVE
jgi:membrane carboxypeptidase/penicillin-binding protein PbpC